MGKDKKNNILCENRKARFDYEISEVLEVGIILLGYEVKALREGKGSIKSSFVSFKGSNGPILKNFPEVTFEMVAPIGKVPKTLLKIESKLAKLEEEFKERFIWHKETLLREKLAELYNEASVLIQPSRYESFGMTILEAMACEAVVIASNVGGLPEVIGKAGRVVSLRTNLFM